LLLTGLRFGTVQLRLLIPVGANRPEQADEFSIARVAVHLSRTGGGTLVAFSFLLVRALWRPLDCRQRSMNRAISSAAFGRSAVDEVPTRWVSRQSDRRQGCAGYCAQDSKSIFQKG
jgi:hypothetical protein